MKLVENVGDTKPIDDRRNARVFARPRILAPIVIHRPAALAIKSRGRREHPGHQGQVASRRSALEYDPRGVEVIFLRIREDPV